MTNLESTSERLNTSRKWLLKTERELSRLKSSTKLSNLKSEIKKSSNAWKFEFKNISRDWKYKVYLYTIEKHWTPSILKYQTVKRGIAKSKDQIKITNKDWVEYKESHKFSAWDKVYVKIETKPQAKPQVKPQERPQVKPQTKPQSKPSNTKIESTSPRIEIQQSEPWKFEYKNTSRDWKYEIYSLTIDSSTTNQWAISNKAKKELNLKNTRWLEITDSKWLKYGPNKTFKNWEKIYLRIPITIENDIQIVDGMKRKWWEYFWIDISKFNEDIDLNKFKKWNRKKRDSKKKDVRWVSFAYIRASDWVTEDIKVSNHVNKIKQYNNDPTIKNKHEQISVWFYHRINWWNTAQQNANTFINTYNKYKNTAGWHNLVPMLDLEGKWIKKSRIEDVRTKALTWLKLVEKQTWIIPWIYVTTSIYRDYIFNDSRFNRYSTRIAAYPESNPNTWREIWRAERINHRTWTVNIWRSNQQFIKPTMYQSSQEWSVDWAYVKTLDGRWRYKKTYHDTDMDHTKDITKLFSKNNRSN